MATYVKTLAKRACLFKGSARAAEAYKVEVASLTSERADLRAQVRHLSEDATMHRSDLKHTLTAKSQVEEQEKKARNELRVAAYELMMVKDELQIAREELKMARDELWVIKARQQADKEELQAVRDEMRLKTTTLSRILQEVYEAESTVGRLNDECRGLHDDLQRQLALVAQKEGVIAELRDEACTLWASNWLSFWRKASKVFPGFRFNFPMLVEDEMGESKSDGEDDLRVSSAAPSSAFLSGDPVVEAAQISSSNT